MQSHNICHWSTIHVGKLFKSLLRGNLLDALDCRLILYTCIVYYTIYTVHIYIYSAQCDKETVVSFLNKYNNSQEAMREWL